MAQSYRWWKRQERDTRLCPASAKRALAASQQAGGNKEQWRPIFHTLSKPSCHPKASALDMIRTWTWDQVSEFFHAQQRTWMESWRGFTPAQLWRVGCVGRNIRESGLTVILDSRSECMHLCDLGQIIELLISLGLFLTLKNTLMLPFQNCVTSDS